MSTDVEVARPGSDGADVSRRRRPAELQRAVQLPQRPPGAALPRRGPGRITLDRRWRGLVLGGSAVRAADGPTGVA